MYEYMSWRVVLACIVSMYCTDCIVPFCISREENYTIWGPLGMGTESNSKKYCCSERYDNLCIIVLT
jgi:hypothetical protein